MPAVPAPTPVPPPVTVTHCASASFEAACRVDALPAGHRARRLHGHGYLAKLRSRLPAGWAAVPGGEVRALRERLEAAVAPLDYALLNDQVHEPTDENVARWLRERLQGSGDVLQIGVQSTAHSGVDLIAGSGGDDAHVWRRYAFQSAHRLPHVPPGHPCGRLHGHGFEVIVHANAPLGTRDLAIDYDHLDALWAPLHAQLDHRCLNELPGLANPTSEVLSQWLWQRLKPALPELSWVTVYETASSGANFDGDHFRIWKEFSFDSALRVARAPAGDALGRVHGHTYVLRLHLRAPLDDVLGWTVDYGDVKRLFAPVFARIDHHPLHEIEGLADADTTTLARWIHDRAREVLPQLDRIDLYETRGSGAIVCTGEDGPALPV